MSTGIFKMVDGDLFEMTAAEIEALTPTEEEAAAIEAAEIQERWLLSRQEGYASITDQLDQLYWDQINGTTVWRDAITAHKSATPKP